ncbi:hypothetical protein BC833DRAFT_569260, partial [Globomyces pollinis-pini]
MATNQMSLYMFWLQVLFTVTLKNGSMNLVFEPENCMKDFDLFKTMNFVGAYCHQETHKATILDPRHISINYSDSSYQIDMEMDDFLTDDLRSFYQNSSLLYNLAFLKNQHDHEFLVLTIHNQININHIMSIFEKVYVSNQIDEVSFVTSKIDHQTSSDTSNLWNEYLEGYSSQNLLAFGNKESCVELISTLSTAKLHLACGLLRVDPETLFKAIWLMTLQTFYQKDDVFFAEVIKSNSRLIPYRLQSADWNLQHVLNNLQNSKEAMQKLQLNRNDLISSLSTLIDTVLHFNTCDQLQFTTSNLNPKLVKYNYQFHQFLSVNFSVSDISYTFISQSNNISFLQRLLHIVDNNLSNTISISLQSKGQKNNSMFLQLPLEHVHELLEY